MISSHFQPWARTVSASRSSAIERNQLGADARQLQPLPHHLHRDAEPRGDVFIAHAAIGQRLEGVELIGGVHGLVDFVFGKTDLGPSPSPVGPLGGSVSQTCPGTSSK
jgi:hypothetical protein